MTLREAAQALGISVEGKDDIELLTQLKARVQDRGGESRAYVRDVRELPPEIFRLDHLRFEALISTSGAITTQAVRVRVPAGMHFILKEVHGYIQESASDQTPDNWARLNFQAREEGRNFDVFTSTLSMASLLGSLSPGHPLQFGLGGYRFASGNHIDPTFSVNTSSTGPGAWVTTTNAKVVGVVFLGELVIAKGAAAS